MRLASHPLWTFAVWLVAGRIQELARVGTEQTLVDAMSKNMRDVLLQEMMRTGV